ncbi:hypothetical protein OAJ57_05000, partial [Alphaproteobacteria bacterium]|nr:hypothetical protein [Alphaproteobacteria bacterium]
VTARWEEFGQYGDMMDAAFESSVKNFYMTDPISRASVTMAECTRAVLGQSENLTGNDG